MTTPERITSDKPVIVILDNNCATSNPCALCGIGTDAGCGPELFLSGLDELVCHKCGREHAPQLLDALLVYREREEFERQKQEEIKRQCLAKYASRSPNRFNQLDCFEGNSNDDSDYVMHFDEDGHCIMGTQTWELMRGASVRVLIAEGVNKKSAAMMLSKLGKSVEHGFCWHDSDAALAEHEEVTPF